MKKRIIIMSILLAAVFGSYSMVNADEKKPASQTEETETTEETEATEETEELSEIKALSSDLFEELKLELAEEDVDVEIDDEGEMTLDSDVLFDFDSDVLTPEGEELLDKFVRAFINVLEQDKYIDLLQSIVIRGYTDSEGSKEYNLDLSGRRADSVLKYWKQSPDVTAALKKSVSGKISTVGMGDENLILDSEGQEIPEKSRRVVVNLYF